MGAKSTREALADLGLKQQMLENGTRIRHKYHRDITGEVRIVGGDYQVKWSNKDDWERLHAGDVGARA